MTSDSGGDFDAGLVVGEDVGGGVVEDAWEHRLPGQ